MLKALPNDKRTVVEILINAFDSNKSVNYIIGSGRKRHQQLMELMGYSFELCMLFGEVYITEDRNACALILLPDKRKQNFQTIKMDIKLALYAVGLANVLKVLKREAAIKNAQVNGRLYYLWFIGVRPSLHGNGIGTGLLKEVLNRGNELKRIVCLETSTGSNLPWYEKNGFRIYTKLDFGFTLYFMKSDG